MVGKADALKNGMGELVEVELCPLLSQTPLPAQHRSGRVFPSNPGRPLPIL